MTPALITLPGLTATHWRPTSPDAAVLLATFGLCLIFLELNRPGWILPGTLGLLLVLLSVPPVLPGPHPLWALALLPLSLGLCALHLRLRLPAVLTLVAILALTLSLRFLISPHHGPPVHWPVAALSGGIVGVLASHLARLALLARLAKQVHPRSR